MEEQQVVPRDHIDMVPHIDMGTHNNNNKANNHNNKGSRSWSQASKKESHRLERQRKQSRCNKLTLKLTIFRTERGDSSILISIRESTLYRVIKRKEKASFRIRKQ